MPTCIVCEDKSADSLVHPCMCFTCASEYDTEIEKAEAEYEKPPCQECGAMTREEAETRCISGGDKDDCHGCHLWPD